jgi:hypothetical protein
MGWIDAELALTAVAAMLSPTTLSFSVLALVLGDRPLRTGVWFYLGALSATLAVGVLAAFVLGNKAASTMSCSSACGFSAGRGTRSGPRAWSTR